MCVFITVCFLITVSLHPFIILRVRLTRLASSLRISHSTKTGGFQRGAPSSSQLSGGVGKPSTHFSLLPFWIWTMGPECPDYMFSDTVPLTNDASAQEGHLKCWTLWYAALRD